MHCLKFDMPPGGLHYRWPDLPGPQIEERMEAKKNAVFAFAEANPIDRHIYDIADAPFGIVTTGKGHLDLMEALRLLGVDEKTCRRLGIDIYKVGMVWPLARKDALNFVRGQARDSRDRGKNAASSKASSRNTFMTGREISPTAWSASVMKPETG